VRFRNPIEWTDARRSAVALVRGHDSQRALSRHVDRRVSLSTKGLLAFCLGVIAFFSILSGKGLAASFDPSIYHSYTATEFWAYDLQAKYPDFVKVVPYGESSYLHNPLFAVEITSNVAVNDPNKADFLFTAGIHAREVISSEAAIKVAEDLVAGFTSADPTTKSRYQNMLGQRDVWIIPQQNPDGRLKVEGGLSAQRKNWNWYAGQSLTGTTRGVDLNRNFPHLWNLASNVVTNETYRGPSVLSESEAKSLWNLVSDKTKFSNLLCSVDFHSGAQTILTPWSSPTDYAQHQNQIPQAIQNKFADLAANLKALTGYSTDRLTYDYYGTESDSLFEQFGSYSMTEELYAGSGDTYSLFNPTTASGRDAVTQKAVASARYLLSDAAFLVPEPSTLLLLAAAAVGLIFFTRQRA
jgi:predicted deacylase